MSSIKVADLAGPGVSTYPEVEKTLPTDYRSLLDPKETQHAVTAVKRYIEDGLCRELNLFRVEVPLIVSAESGVNDYLDRDGSRTPIEFPWCGPRSSKRSARRRTSTCWSSTRGRTGHESPNLYVPLLHPIRNVFSNDLPDPIIEV